MWKRGIKAALAAIFVQGLMAGSASAAVFGFDCITSNSATNCAAGEAQLSVDVTAVGGRVGFRFNNSGPSASSITDIYFDFGTTPNSLSSIHSITESSGVSFSQGAAPPNLPGGNTILFEADVAADSDSPTQPNGVNPGEWVQIVFNLTSGSTFQSVLDEMNSGPSSWLRVGIHVQGFANGGSESFVTVGDGGGGGNNVPEPASLALVGVSLLGLAAVRRRRMG